MAGQSLFRWIRDQGGRVWLAAIPLFIAALAGIWGTTRIDAVSAGTPANAPTQTPEDAHDKPVTFAVLDRIADGKHGVLLVGEREQEIVVPSEGLPQGAAPGVWLQVRVMDDADSGKGESLAETHASQAGLPDVDPPPEGLSSVSTMLDGRRVLLLLTVDMRQTAHARARIAAKLKELRERETGEP